MSFRLPGARMSPSSVAVAVSTVRWAHKRQITEQLVNSSTNEGIEWLLARVSAKIGKQSNFRHHNVHESSSNVTLALASIASAGTTGGVNPLLTRKCARPLSIQETCDTQTSVGSIQKRPSMQCPPIDDATKSKRISVLTCGRQPLSSGRRAKIRATLRPVYTLPSALNH